MAKKAKVSEMNETPAETPAPDVALPTEYKYSDWSLKAPSQDAMQVVANEMGISLKSVSYLLANGFTQSMTDAAAFTKEQKTNEDGTAKTDDEVKAMAVERRQARYDNIVAGTVGHRVGGASGPRGTTLDKVIRDIAIERLKAAALARNVTLPKGDKLTSLRDQYIERHRDNLTAAANERIASAKAMADDVGDLLG